MKRIISAFFILTGMFAFLFAIIFMYQKDEELRSYKKRVLGMRYDNIKLQIENNNLKEKTQNLRQITILNNNPQSRNAKIANTINNFSEKVDGNLSIYFKNLTTGESVIIDGDRKYYMASLYKIILTLYIIDQIKQGKVKLTDEIGDPSISIEEALNKIVTESNNEYAQSLGEKFGWEKIEKAMKQKLGIDFSFDTTLQANVKNIGALFEDIALSLKISDNESKYLLKLLGDQQKISKLPKYLPKNIYSHNKTGEFEDYSHDAGIFYTPKANYILIFMSKTNDPADTDEQMAQMSKKIYEELNN